MAGDPYRELGVARSASADELRKAFRKLAKQLHPDQNPGDAKAEERFKRVSAAFDLLGDPEKRGRFDRGEIDADGRETVAGYGRGGFGGAEGPWGARGGAAEGPDLDELLGSMFGRGGAAGAGGRRFTAKGPDVKARVEIDLEEAILGATKRLAFSDGRTVDVTVPKGAADGQTLRLKGQGSPGRGGGPNGDALIELAVRPHPVFRREGTDLHMDLPVSLPDAVLGAKVQAPTPEGPVTLTVPKGSNSGARLRLKGRGASAGQGQARGDLFAQLMVTLPEPADGELVKVAERMRKAGVGGGE